MISPQRASARLSFMISERIRSVPLFYKVLIANVAIVMFGAIAGTYVTATTFRDAGAPSRFELILMFVAIGVVLSVAVNYLVLRAAFQPLDSLERMADAVRDGDLSARANPLPLSDPQLARLVDTFNGTLDELERGQARLRELTTQVIEAQEAERQRIARELHDDTAQILFAQLLSVSALKSSPHEAVRTTAENLETLTVEAIEGVRRLALELRPPVLDDLGVREALGDLAQRFSENTGVQVELEVTGSRDRLAPEAELVLYRVAQEAMTNVVKHARATEARITLARWPDRVDLTVDDNGTGFDPANNRPRDSRGLGLGLFGMEERVVLVGGTLAIRALVPSGTRIAVSLPLHTSGVQQSIST
ncbi:MAG: sensor histidine kinase [Chloroflexota bacterium]|nr:sensor histidine kinase [Chloroflexota bacterium]